MRELFGNFALSCPPLLVACHHDDHDDDHGDDHDDDHDDDDYDKGDDNVDMRPVDVVEYFRRLVVDDIVLPDLDTVLESDSSLLLYLKIA